MKKFFVTLSVAALSMQALAVSECLQRASNGELIAEVSSRMGNGGGGGGDAVLVDSVVDMKCVDGLAQKYPYQPNVELLVSWAGQCRTTVDNRCLLIYSQANTACVDGLARKYPYQPNQDDLQRFSTACTNKRFSCRTN